MVFILAIEESSAAIENHSVNLFIFGRGIEIHNNWEKKNRSQNSMYLG